MLKTFCEQFYFESEFFMRTFSEYVDVEVLSQIYLPKKLIRAVY